MSDLEQRVALVTGAARGIGRAVAERLARDRVRLVLNDIDAEALAETSESLNDAIAVPGDLTDPVFPDRLIETATAQFGTLDIVVNNAGYIWNGAVHNHTDEQWQAMLDMHATAPFRILRSYGRWLRSLDPDHRSLTRKVVNVSSVSGIYGAATQIAYSAGKAAIVGITRTLSKEWGRLNVTVNAVAFGHIETRLTQTYSDEPATIEVKGRQHKVGLTQQQLDATRQMTPLGRPGTPDDAAGAIYLFCLPESDFVSGEVLVCGGGLRS